MRRLRRRRWLPHAPCSGKAIALAILAANLLLLLGPPLISQDVFGYLEFARLGVLHGLDPYTHVAAEAPTDAVFPFIGWPFQHSPYGPLFTLGTYPLASLGLGGWPVGVQGARAVASKPRRGCAHRTRRGGDGTFGQAAAVFVGLNPVLLELAVGGAHNDTLVLLILAGALALAARKTGTPPARAGGDAVSMDMAGRRGARAGASRTAQVGAHNLRAAAALLVVGIGVKASAGLVLPFVVLAPALWRERVRVAASALAALVLLAIVAVVGFGTHAFGFLGALWASNSN